MKVNCPKCNSVNFLPSTLPASIISNITCAVCKAVITIPNLKETTSSLDDDLMDVSKLRNALDNKTTELNKFSTDQTNASSVNNKQSDYSEVDFFFQTPTQTSRSAKTSRFSDQSAFLQTSESGPIFLNENEKSKKIPFLVKVVGINLVVITFLFLIVYFGLKIFNFSSQSKGSAKRVSSNENSVSTSPTNTTESVGKSSTENGLANNSTTQTGTTGVGSSGGDVAQGEEPNKNQIAVKNHSNVNNSSNMAQGNTTAAPANGVNQNSANTQTENNAQRERIAKTENKTTDTTENTSDTGTAQGSSVGGSITVQVGSYPSINEASAHAAKLQSAGFTAQIVKAYIPKKRSTWFRVQVGRFASRGEAERYAQSLKSKGVTRDVFITEVGQ